MKPKGILFDLDDTIIAFGAVSRSSWKAVCEQFSGQAEHLSTEQLHTGMLEAHKWYWSDRERHRVGRNDLDNTRRKIARLALEKLGIKKDLSAIDRTASAAFSRRNVGDVKRPR